MPHHLNLLHDPYSLSVPEIGAAFAKRHFDFSWLDGVPERMQALEEYYGRDGDGYRVDVDACLANLRRELDRQSKVPDVQEIKRLRSERANLTSLTAYQSGFISAEG
jgi:hypothetical protein